MFKKVSIDESALPSKLDAENALRVAYKTNLAFPLTGPVVESHIVRYLKNVYRDLYYVARMIEALVEYKSRYKIPLSIPSQTLPLQPSRPGMGGYLDNFVKPMRDVLLGEGHLSHLNEASEVTGANTLMIGPTEAGRTPQLRDRGAILMTAAQPNMVMEDLYKLGILKAEGSLLQSRFFETKDPLQLLAESLARHAQGQVDEPQVKELSPLIDHAVAMLDQQERTDLQDKLRKNATLAELLHTYGAYRVQTHPNLAYRVGTLVDPHREWALQRHEVLRMFLQTPVLRGPIHASPVAPKSKRTTTETQTQSTQEVLARSTGRTSRFTEGQAQLTASAFQSKLDNLTEWGISSETAFANDSTLLSTLTEQRREAVETVAREISRAAETQSISKTLHTSGLASEYTTEGKDDKLATTELQFQVVVPTQASVHLENVGMVWCPRVASPFRALHAHIIDYEEQTRLAYIAQHYVPQPVMPPIKTTTLKTEVFEVQIDGTSEVNTRRFSRRIKFNDPYARIDVDHITATHRNGTSDDFNWDERFNYDDLENASARIRELEVSESGHMLKGLAVLETTDPEALNRSFVTISVPVITYTEETVAALAQYQNQLKEKDLKEQVIRSRATQYAVMKRDELIAEWEESYKVQQEAFRALMRRLYSKVKQGKISYYEEILRRCINWEEASIQFESQPLPNLIFKHLAPDHFMNCPGIRFFLPIHQNALDLFFDTLNKAGYSAYTSNAKKVRKHLEAIQDKITAWKANDPDKLRLDQFNTEIMIGKHLEAVLSQYDFSQ